jgi:polysaccharide export outer membrane protein
LLAVALAEGCSVRHSATGKPGERVVGELITARDRARLTEVATARASSSPDNGYRIGPDDLLDVRIPDLLDAQSAGARVTQGEPQAVAQAPLFQQGLRVGADGKVTVPLVGPIRAEGLTATELEQAIAQRLVSAGILRAPQVSVLIAEYRSRVVAVIGSVERPGLYPLTRPGATLADLVWAAGGPNREAGRVVEFVPAEEAQRDRSPIHLDLETLLSRAPDGTAPSPLARAGDVISLQPAGSVLVDGWVEKPGSYPATRGLTVSGAVAAAGGHSFPANRRRALVKRQLGSGEDQSFTIDLEAVERGEAQDLPLRDGDVVRLPPTYARLIPYGVWTVAREVVHVGGSVPLF